MLLYSRGYEVHEENEMLAPDKIFESMQTNQDLYWDYCFLIMWFVLVGFGICAIMSAIMTEDHIIDQQRKWKEQDRKRLENKDNASEKGKK